MGDPGATRAAVGRADDAFSAAAPADDPPRMSYYTAAEHAGTCGAALTDLALAAGADPAPAAERQQAAVDGHAGEYARSRAHASTQLAMLTMATGDPDEAAAVGLRAVHATGPLQSRRSGDYLRALRRLSDRHAGRPAVDELRSQITLALAG